MWHHSIHQPTAMFQMRIFPAVTSSSWSTDRTLPRVSVRTCHAHPCSGDTCHFLVGPPVHVNIRMPSHPTTCHLQKLPTMPSTLAVWSYDLYSFHVALYRLYNHHFFPVCPNEHIKISGAYNVCLSPFKLCWVHIDEAYTHVCFEAIMRNFIFRPF